MQNSKVIFFFVIIAITCKSCLPILPEFSYGDLNPLFLEEKNGEKSKEEFVVDSIKFSNRLYNSKLVSTSYLTDLPSISQEVELNRRFNKIDSLGIYKAIFQEELVEDQNTLTPALLSPNYFNKGVYYIPFNGEWQEIYLLRLYTNNPNVVPFIYLSAKYNSRNECIGLGPSYLGYFFDELNIPILDIDLRMIGRKKNKSYRLVQENSAQLKFILNQEFHPNQDIKRPIVIDKVVIEDNNKIGGPMPIYFNVKDILENESALKFNYVGNIIL